MKSTIEHNEFKLEPTDDKAKERLETMLRTMQEVEYNSSRFLGGIRPITYEGVEKIELMPGVFAHVVHFNGGFKGVRICSHCLTNAAMYLRDLANICDELIKEAETNGMKVKE